jgi:hypothetical protein
LVADRRLHSRSRRREEADHQFEISHLRFQIVTPPLPVSAYDVSSVYSLPIDVSALYSLKPAYTRLNLKFSSPKPTKTAKNQKIVQPVAGFYRLLQPFTASWGRRGAARVSALFTHFYAFLRIFTLNFKIIWPMSPHSFQVLQKLADVTRSISFMLSRVLSAAVNGIEAYPVEVEVNSGWGETLIVIVFNIYPMS